MFASKLLGSTSSHMLVLFMRLVYVVWRDLDWKGYVFLRAIPKTKELHEFMWLRVAIYAHFQLGEETPELLARLEESRNNLLASLGRKRAQPFAARPSRRRQPDPPDTSATTAKVSKPLTRGPRELELIGVFIPPLQTHVARQGNNQSHPHQESRDSSLSPSIGKAPSPEPSSDPSSDSNSSSGNSSNGDSNSMCFMSDSPSVIEDVDFS
ncbi:hypothetical protein FQN49_001877 [Arthroderma sp. PD_2]|nr:hypothetical protein FQN49_001877 [Arthroderma sp. PD_2]